MKKGSVQHGVIVWVGLLMAVSITMAWVIPKIKPYHLDMEKNNADIEALQGKIDAACSSMFYRTKYNPVTEVGTLSINGSSICINNTMPMCRLALCNISGNLTVDLSNITYVVVEKQNESCMVYGE